MLNLVVPLAIVVASCLYAMPEACRGVTPRNAICRVVCVCE